MSLEPGRRLGPYEILARLGAGGMGEVYRARDTRLGREVAVKILTDRLSASPEVRRRFEREARVISSLSHPNICTLHDVGRHDGIEYLVMELLEGETLAQRLERGPLPLAETLRVAIQVAGGLDCAHRNAIVHRDLKPGNIMLTKSGAKLLDFGLARSAGAAAGPAEKTTQVALSPTVSQPLTAEGTLIGTFQYMAPEQLEGTEADARTDLFAFGTILYEMVTGRRAFEGKSKASLIGAIMSAEPPSMTERAPLAPPDLERLTRACLQKDPDERIQTAHDLGMQLRWLAEPLSGVGAVRSPSRSRGNREVIWMAAAFGLALLVLGLAATLMLRATGASLSPDPMRLVIMPPDGVTWQPWNSMAISPDGRQLLFYATDADGGDGLWLRPVDSMEARRLPGTEPGNASFPFWSPDSRSFGFFAGGKLRTMLAQGGSPVTICDAPDGQGGAWAPDGTIVFSPQQGAPLMRVASVGGQPVAVTKLAPRQSGGHRWPWLLPDGRHFTYMSLGESKEDSQVHVGSLDSQESAKLLGADSGAVYADPGYLLFVRDAMLLAQPFDAGRLRLSGTPLPIAAGIGRNLDTYYNTFTVSRTNKLLYRSGAPSTRQLMWFDRTGRRLGTIGTPSDLEGPELSPDGGRVVYERFEDGSTDDLWVHDLGRGTASRLTFGAGNASSPVWSPDGRTVYFSAERGGRWGLYVKDGSGATEEKPVPALTAASNSRLYVNDVSRDGLYLAFETESDLQSDLWVFPLRGGEATSLIATRFTEARTRFSPDVRFIAYESDESGRSEIYVRTFPQAVGKWQISAAGGAQPRWRGDGREIYYLAPDRLLMAVTLVQEGGSLRAGIPEPLFRTGLASVNSPTWYTASPDGRRFLVVMPEEGTVTVPTVVFLDWASTLGGAGR